MIWSFLAVIWFLILDTSDITSGSGNATIGLGGRNGNRTQEPLVIAVPQYQNYGSAWLTQLYLAIFLCFDPSSDLTWQNDLQPNFSTLNL